MSKFGDWYETHDQVPDKLRSQILRSMFPPSAEQAAEFGLQRWYNHSLECFTWLCDSDKLIGQLETIASL